MMIAGVYDFSNWKDEFIKHLSDNGCKPSTAKDYAGRIEKIINNEGVTVQELSARIDQWIEEYKTGIYASKNKTSHYAWSSALIKFKNFLPRLCKPYNPQPKDPLEQFTKEFRGDILY
jgi:hypothetical protein